MNNKKLKKIYDDAKLNWHLGFNESLFIVQMMESWEGLSVLEIGCGEGNLASLLAYGGANVTAVDYSEEQIKRAVKNYNTNRVSFSSTDFHELIASYDVVVMQGVMEHMDKPAEELQYIAHYMLNKNGCIVLSVPHWVNPRGFIYNALRILFDAKMSLTDLHYFLPADLSRMATHASLEITDYGLCDDSWGSGKEAIADLADRIPKALPDLPKENIDKFINWLQYALLDPSIGKLTGFGATAVCKLQKTKK